MTDRVAAAVGYTISSCFACALRFLGFGTGVISETRRR